MALSDYLTNQEKRKIEELKLKLLEAVSIQEIRFIEQEIHLLLDIAEKRAVEYKEKNVERKITSITD